jgi:hypothetical protein
MSVLISSPFRRVGTNMDPIGRRLNSEEVAILTVLKQEGRNSHDCTASGIAVALERDPVDVAGALSRLQKDGLTAGAINGDGEECWSATPAAETL